MGTEFTEIYNRAINRFKNYAFLNMHNDEREEKLFAYLNSALVDFKYVSNCNINEYDLRNKKFKVILSEEEKELLALGITYYWISQETYSSDLISDKIGRKDYTMFSPGNLLDKVSTLKNNLESEYRSKINLLSWNLGNLKNKKVGK